MNPGRYSMINVAKVILLVLAGSGFYFTWGLFLGNGSVSHMTHIRDHGPSLLPGTTEPLKTDYGLGMIPKANYQLAVLTLFFWEQVDGSRPDASLYCFHFAGQIFVGWQLLMLEGIRKGNRGKIISFLAIWGVLMQNFTYATVIPIYLILHLSTSPTLEPVYAAGDFAADVCEIPYLPLSMIFGYLLPAVLLSLPAPSVLSFGWKQIFVAFWQAFPIWVSLIYQLLAMFRETPTTLSKGNKMSSLRNLYVFLLVAAGATQMSTIALSVVSTIFPGRLGPSYVGAFSLSRVFIPTTVSRSMQMDSIGAGAQVLLQYDQIFGSASMMLWATVLLLRARSILGKHPLISVTCVSKGLLAFMLTGPLGYAVACIWARDELILGDTVDKTKKLG